jgi:hypothetical protein
MTSITTLVGKKVTVYSRLGETEKQDVGILDGADNLWLVLKKADGETMFFTLYNLRMVKPFEPL